MILFSSCVRRGGRGGIVWVGRGGDINIDVQMSLYHFKTSSTPGAPVIQTVLEEHDLHQQMQLRDYSDEKVSLNIQTLHVQSL